MTFRRFTKRATVLSLFLGILLAGSVAFAWWTASGSGTGYAEAETSGGALTTVASTTSPDLHPGGSGDFTITVHNPNSYAVTLTDVVQSGPALTSSSDAACEALDSVHLADQNGLSYNLPAGADTPLTFAGQVSRDYGTSADNSCQGEVFEIPVDLTGVNA
jgi:hypothetical protein